MHRPKVTDSSQSLHLGWLIGDLGVQSLGGAEKYRK